MKLHKLCMLNIVFVAIAVLSNGQRVWADLAETESFVNNFNGMNGSTGFHFSNDSLVSTNTNPPGLVVLNADPNYQVNPDLFGAYVGTTMRTFCIQPTIPIRSNVNLGQYGNAGFTGRLVYENGKTFTYDNEGKSHNLTVGSAYLYKAYITGDLERAGFTELVEIGMLIRYFTNPSDQLPGGIFFNWYMGLSDDILSIWNESYDPAANYSFMDNYQVFVMEVWDELLHIRSQDFLFIRLFEPDHAPEPTTILFWTLGAVGAIGYARKRSRLSKQNVL